MSTAHERGAQDVYDRWMSTPEGAVAFSAIWRGLHDGHLDPGYVAVLGQQFIGPWSPWDALMIGLMHAEICNGQFGLAKVRAQAAPLSDSRRADNALALADLPHPFVAEVSPEQNGADSDGDLAWTEPIEVDVATEETERASNGWVRNVLERITVKPRRIPLEIGTTKPSRTRLHAVQDGGVARWPYGQDWITIIVPLNHDAVDRIDPARATPPAHSHLMEPRDA